MGKEITSYVGQKVRAVKFLQGAKGAACLEGDECAVPLLVAGGYDSSDTAISLLFPQMPTADHMDLADEFGNEASTEIVELCSLEHAGDVTSLGFLSLANNDFVVSGSSNGSLYVSSIIKSDASLALKSVAIPQWEHLSLGSLAGIDVDSPSASIVAACESGQVVWANLDRPRSVLVLDLDEWATHDVKMLGIETHIALACANPRQPLQLWDLKASHDKPVSTSGAAGSAYTCLAAHPTRPELLLAGTKDGSLTLWDRRFLGNGALRTECRHKKAVRSVKWHDAKPGFVFTASDDHTVLSWDFYAGNGSPSSDKVDYERHSRDGGVTVTTVANGILPWNTLDVDGVSDTLIAGSDNHSVVLVDCATS
ncbi:hypothetical protein H310_00884 [Aphanomyces invadans]|uniref:Uncharacterized protein n=1 Tax=Aphanomyces invadans TaxID=157072 RepID=A0A024UQW7_9STRA|nr:hypothetical protein H310_00884 [Aphanomyces invadans]ETW08247.1 hypothetical protein H310_00884 [Aphanomyces invadans]|eukprot:XP_008862052.1 hypothetical protein H310_00884 [Aphanomyces invadans]